MDVLNIKISRVVLCRASNYFVEVIYQTERDNVCRYRTDVVPKSSNPQFRFNSFACNFPLISNQHLHSQIITKILEVHPKSNGCPNGLAEVVAIGMIQFVDLGYTEKVEHKVNLYKTNSEEIVGSCLLLVWWEVKKDPLDTTQNAVRRGLQRRPSETILLYPVAKYKKSKYTLSTFTELRQSCALGPGPWKFVIRPHGVVRLQQKACPFLAVKTTADVASRRPAKVSTSAPITPTMNVVWHEPLLFSINETDVCNGDALFLAIVDHKSKAYLSKCILAVDDITPGEQYNLAIEFNEDGTKMYLSVMLQRGIFLQKQLFTKYNDICRVEVFLHGVQSSTTFPNYRPFDALPVLAVLHITNDVDKYITKTKKKLPALPFHVMSFPSSGFNKLSPSKKKLAYPSLPSIYPQWNTIFEFNMGSEDRNNALHSALIIELFKIDFPTEGREKIEYCGFAVAPLSSLETNGTIVHVAAPINLKEKHISVSLNIEMEIGCWSAHNYLNFLNTVNNEDQVETICGLRRKAQEFSDVHGPSSAPQSPVDIPWPSIFTNIQPISQTKRLDSQNSFHGNIEQQQQQQEHILRQEPITTDAELLTRGIVKNSYQMDPSDGKSKNKTIKHLADMLIDYHEKLKKSEDELKQFKALEELRESKYTSNVSVSDDHDNSVIMDDEELNKLPKKKLQLKYKILLKKHLSLLNKASKTEKITLTRGDSDPSFQTSPRSSLDIPDIEQNLTVKKDD